MRKKDLPCSLEELLKRDSLMPFWTETDKKNKTLQWSLAKINLKECVDNFKVEDFRTPHY